MQDILFKPSYIRRVIFFFSLDILIIIFSLYLSFCLRYDFRLSAEYMRTFEAALPYFILIKLISFAGFRMYKMTWIYVGISDLCNIAGGLAVANSVLMVLFLVPLPPALTFLSAYDIGAIPRSIFLIDGTISLILVSLLRISKRLYFEIIRKGKLSGGQKRTIIIGAGNTGEMVLRDITRQGFSEFYPIALLDDNKAKVGAYLHGVKVFGTTDKLKDAVKRFEAEAVIIAIPSLDHKILRNIYGAAKECKVDTIKIVPRIYDFQRPYVNLKGLEEIRIEDLIGRQVVSVDYREIEQFLQDKIILVTGAGGSIGSEITKQVCAFAPRKLILFDIDETALHNMQLAIKRNFPGVTERMHFIAGDIRDENRVGEVMTAFSPQIVFHAAAYKHVPMMEYNPKEAVKVNMFGTDTVAKASIKAGVKKFIMISTDKAVRPTSIMGATKRMAEYICKALNNTSWNSTDFISVRFGNVLGSRGSVLPLFLEQLKYGGPLTVTHKDMLRYFMTIPEAVSLVLQASVMGKAGEILVLDMGDPVRVVELAEELIRIHSLEPYKDIDIEFIGLRPGEKLFEEILTAEEGTAASKHEKIFISRNTEKYTLAEMNAILEEFAELLRQPLDDEHTAVRGLLKKYVRYFDEV